MRTCLFGHFLNKGGGKSGSFKTVCFIDDLVKTSKVAWRKAQDVCQGTQDVRCSYPNTFVFKIFFVTHFGFGRARSFINQVSPMETSPVLKVCQGNLKVFNERGAFSLGFDDLNNLGRNTGFLRSA